MRGAAIVLALCALSATVLAAGDLGKTTGSITDLIQGMSTNLQGNDKGKTSLESLLPNGGAAMQSSLITQLMSGASAASSMLTSLEDRYCTPGSFFAGAHKPASFVGHSFQITLDSGNCTFSVHDYLFKDKKRIECRAPSINFVKKPALFASKYWSPAAFSSKYCNMTHTFGGVASQQVLYTFDGTGSIPTASDLWAKAYEEGRNMFGGLGSSGLGSNFLSGGLFSGSNGGGMLGGLDALSSLFKHSKGGSTPSTPTGPLASGASSQVGISSVFNNAELLDTLTKMVES